MFQARDDAGQWTAGGFEVALHADVELPVAPQPRGVDDRAANGVRRSVAANSLHVRTSGSVTWLAVDPFRHRGREYAFFRRL